MSLLSKSIICNIDKVRGEVVSIGWFYYIFQWFMMTWKLFVLSECAEISMKPQINGTFFEKLLYGCIINIGCIYMNINFRTNSVQLFPPTSRFVLFIYICFTCFCSVGLSLSKTRFPEVKQSSLDFLIDIVIIMGSIKKGTHFVEERREELHSPLENLDVVCFVISSLYLLKISRNVAPIRAQSIYR